MDVNSIRRFCLSLPQVKENLQWGEDLCFKVGGKIFAVLDLRSVAQRLSFKCLPERFSELIEQADIVPAPYVGRYKWVLLQRLDALAEPELKALVLQSYGMVAAKVKPKASKRRGRGARREKSI
jgi:predicted DNA-binding protein (MmcQ/YjbR family)